MVQVPVQYCRKATFPIWCKAILIPHCPPAPFDGRSTKGSARPGISSSPRPFISCLAIFPNYTALRPSASFAHTTSTYTTINYSNTLHLPFGQTSLASPFTIHHSVGLVWDPVQFLCVLLHLFNPHSFHLCRSARTIRASNHNITFQTHFHQCPFICTTTCGNSLRPLLLSFSSPDRIFSN